MRISLFFSTFLPNKWKPFGVLGSQTMEQIRALEIERTEEVSQNDDETKLTCRIPAGDEKVLQIKNEFLTGVRETIGGDNFTVIEQ